MYLTKKSFACKRRRVDPMPIMEYGWEVNIGKGGIICQYLRYRPTAEHVKENKHEMLEEKMMQKSGK